MLDAGRLPMPSAPLDNGTGYQLSELYAALNADIPLMDMAAKMAAVDREFRLHEGQSDADVIIGHRPDTLLVTSHRQLADRIEAFRTAECQLNNELVRYCHVIRNGSWLYVLINAKEFYLNLYNDVTDVAKHPSY